MFFCSVKSIYTLIIYIIIMVTIKLQFRLPKNNIELKLGNNKTSTLKYIYIYSGNIASQILYISIADWLDEW